MDCAEGKIWSPAQTEVLTSFCHGTSRTPVKRTFICTHLGQGSPFPPSPWVLRDKPIAKDHSPKPQLFSPPGNDQNLRNCLLPQVSNRSLHALQPKPFKTPLQSPKATSEAFHLPKSCPVVPDCPGPWSCGKQPAL